MKLLENKATNDGLFGSLSGGWQANEYQDCASSTPEARLQATAKLRGDGEDIKGE